MINIANQSEFNNTMDQWLLQYYDLMGNKWKEIQNKFLMDKKINIINISTLKHRYRILNTLDGKQRITLTKDESDMCWLVGIKACSCRLPIQKVWEKNTLARKNFLSYFSKAYCRLIQLLVQTDRKILKLQKLRVIREEAKDQYFNQMKSDFQRMITVITYVVMSKTIMNESILSFCNKDQFENAIQNLSKLDQMRLLTLKGDQLIDPLQKTYTYAKLFIKEPLAFDPFQDSDFENSDDLDNKKTVPNSNNNNNNNNINNNSINYNYNNSKNKFNNNQQNQNLLKPEKQDIVIDDGYSLSFEKQEEEDDSGSYDIEDISQ